MDIILYLLFALSAVFLVRLFALKETGIVFPKRDRLILVIAPDLKHAEYYLDEIKCERFTNDMFYNVALGTYLKYVSYRNPGDMRNLRGYHRNTEILLLDGVAGNISVEMMSMIRRLDYSRWDEHGLKAAVIEGFKDCGECFEAYTQEMLDDELKWLHKKHHEERIIRENAPTEKEARNFKREYFGGWL